MSRKVRVGVIGAGVMGLRHCQTLAQRVPGAELAAVADIDKSAAREATALAAGAAASIDHRALLADPGIDAVVIASPNDTHARLIREAAAAGKHIFCEKPIALDMEGADSALVAVRRQGVRLQIGFQRRFDAAYQTSRRAIGAGELGALELIVATTRDPKPPSLEQLRRSGGLFLDTAIHDLDSIRYLTGLDITEVYARASTLVLDPAYGFVDTAATVLRLETGALAVLTNSLRTGSGYDVRIEIAGQRGKLEVEHDRAASFLERFEEAYIAEIAHFVECVSLDREPEVTGEDGRMALVLALAAERSAREGRSLPIDEAR